jgi:hypothetical protein
VTLNTLETEYGVNGGSMSITCFPDNAISNYLYFFLVKRKRSYKDPDTHTN